MPKKQAICIQCHDKPELVNYLTSVMPSEAFDFFIHVDKKSDILPSITRRGNVYFANRVNVYWGRFSQVEATLSMFRMVDPDGYSYIHLISGADFIAKPPEEFIEFFSSAEGEFIESFPLGGDCTWSWHGLDRYQCWYPQWLIRRPADGAFRLARVTYRELVMRTAVFRRRDWPVPAFYGGSQWFSISGGGLRWLMDYLDGHPEYVEFFRHGICPDEVFFQTLIRYSPFERQIDGRHLRFMKWEGATTGGPKLIDECDFDAMVSSDCFFARKFNDLDAVNKFHAYLNSQRLDNH